jgi:hypothetical protein
MKYGMRYSSILYWQGQAWSLWIHNGILRGVSTFDPRNLPIASSRDIGHIIIGLARVMSADRLKALLTS